MAKKFFRINVLILFLVLVFYGISFANSYEYVTHGGYDAAVEAWKRVALIFSSDNFLGLFSIGFIAGLLFLIIGIFLRSAFGLKITPHVFIPYLIAGGLVYVALILPKDDIWIYDETLNRGPYTVSGVPKGLAFLAGTLNKIERGVIELIATSGDPVEDYRLNPAGLVFNAFGSMNGEQVPYYIFASLKNYFQDCVIYELERPGASINMDQIMRGEKTLRDVIEAAKNPSLYVSIYDPSGAEINTDCSSAGNTLLSSNYIGSISNFENIFKGGCAKAGYDVNSVQSYQQCKNAVSSSANWLLQKGGIATGGVTDILLAQQLLFSGIVRNYVLANGPAAVGSYLATQQSAGSFIGLGMHANSWIPEMKEALTSLVIALSPLILVFVVTPLGGRAISVLCGFFIWLTVWGIVDALVHSFGLSMAGQYAKYVNIGGGVQGFGIYAASVIPNAVGKIYALFGALRWSGLTLSSVLATMLVRFGGAALTMVASQIASQPMAAGSSIGQKMSTNPMQTVLDSFSSAQNLANIGYAVGGMRNLVNSYMAHQRAQIARQLADGQSWSQFEASRGGFMNAVSDWAYAGYVGMRKTMAGTATWKAFEKEFGPMFQRMGYSQQDLEKFYGRVGGSIGKGYQTAASLTALKMLHQAGAISLTDRQKEALEKGDFMEQLTLAEKMQEAGGMKVMNIMTKDGTQIISTFQTPGKESHISFMIDPWRGRISVYDLKLAKGLNTSREDAWKVAEILKLMDEKKLQEDWNKVLSSKDETKLSKETKSIYAQEYIKGIEKTIEEYEAKDKSFSDFLRQSGMTRHELAAAIGMRMNAGIEAFGMGGGAYADAKYAYQNLSQSEKGKEFLEKLMSGVRSNLANIEKQATKNTFERVLSKGYSHSEVEESLKKVGATNLVGLAQALSYEETLGLKGAMDYNIKLVEWYAQKNNLNWVDAFYKVNSLQIEEAEKVKMDFLKDLIKGDVKFSQVKDRLNEGAKKFNTDFEDIKEDVEKKVSQEGKISQVVQDQLKDVEPKVSKPMIPRVNTKSGLLGLNPTIEKQGQAMKSEHFIHSIPFVGAPAVRSALSDLGEIGFDAVKGLKRTGEWWFSDIPEEDRTKMLGGIVRSGGIMEPLLPSQITMEPQRTIEPQKIEPQRVEPQRMEQNQEQSQQPQQPTVVIKKESPKVNWGKIYEGSEGEVEIKKPNTDKLREILAKRRS